MQPDTWRTEITWLLQAAMLVFVLTVVLGILNGQQVIKPEDQAARLAHVHSGTLGWITLSVLSLGLWLFGEGDPSHTSRTVIRWLSILAAVSVPVYVLAFLSGNLVARAIFGTPVLLAIAGWFLWLRSVILDLPEAVKHAAPILAREGMGDRVTHRAGNALTDDLGTQAWDLVFIASVVHGFNEQANRDLVRRIARPAAWGHPCDPGFYPLAEARGGRAARRTL